MFFLILAAILGWFTGAAVNYLADVLPLSPHRAGPVCLACQSPMRLVNYFFWPRRCSKCGKRRLSRTWLVEIFYLLASIWLWASPREAFGFIIALSILFYFGLVTVIDIEHRAILHPVSLAGAALAAVIGTSMHGWQATLLGGVAGFGGMFVLYYLGIKFVHLTSRMRGQPVEEEEGLGFGDVNLGGVIGLILGWPGIIAGLVLAILLAGAISLVYVLFMLVSRRYHPNLALPYGPFLAASAVILLFFKGAFLR